MKPLFLTICCIGSFPLFAQNGFYLKPEIGAGAGSVFTNRDKQVSDIVTYSAQLGIGYQKNKWRLESGIRYFTTGYVSRLTFENPNNMPSLQTGVLFQSGDLIYTFTHIALPLSVGYKISLAKKCALVPALGLMVSYNPKYNTRMRSDFYNSSTDYSTTGFDGQYKRISTWASAALNIEYKIGKRLNMLAGVQAVYMLNSMFVKGNFYYGYYQYNYSATLNLGVKWDLGKIADKAVTK